MYAFTSMGVVVVSTVVFILSTMPELTDDIDMILFTNTTDTAASPAAAAATDTPPVERWEEVGCGLEAGDNVMSLCVFLQGILALNIIDHATMVFFTLGEW